MPSDKLLNFGQQVYNQKDFTFSKNLYERIKSLNFGEESALIGFFARANIYDDSIRKKLLESFGENVIESIELLQRLSRITVPERERRIRQLREFFVELSSDVRIIIIKLAERLEALIEAERLKKNNIKRLSEESLFFYSTIAHRLGISKLYTEMEDIAFKHLYPNEYRKIERFLGENKKVYEEKLKNMILVIKNILEKNGIKARTQYRLKRPYSIYRKMQNKKVGFDEIFDLMAIRIITNEINSCYTILGLVHSNWTPINGRFRDWISNPKPNGYRSIQTTIISRTGDKYEIQIRTEDMHREAEYGAAAHWSYKEGVKATSGWTIRLKEFLENDEIFENPIEALEHIQSEIKKDYISVITPKGEVISLPEGSTPLDFAYMVHTEVGHHTTGARVNQRFVSLKTELKSGDVVEIITQKNSKPSRNWLNFVKTSKAKSKIREWFRKNEREAFIKEGKRIFDSQIKKHKKKYEGFDKEQEFKENLLKYGYKNIESLYFAIGTKSVKAGLPLLKKLFPLKHKRKDGFLKKKKSVDSLLSPQIIIEGEKNIDFKIARCCRPLKGEPIVAYITKNSGIKVHSVDCPYIKSGTMDPERLRKAEWVGDSSFQQIRVRIKGENLEEIVSSLAEVCKNNDIFLNSIKRLDSDETSAIEAELLVKSMDDFIHMKNLLLKKNGVNKVILLR